jgi:mannose/cellobiose epimerase-like protein (N-acyl-D-glucosamine 2-epimerase family)
MQLAQSLSPARWIQAVAADDLFQQQNKEGYDQLFVVVAVAASIASAYRRRR